MRKPERKRTMMGMRRRVMMDSVYKDKKNAVTPAQAGVPLCPALRRKEAGFPPARE
jgi:hypothetical protein